ncbi:hypothetical protein NQ318_013223 [Aromia moschata]|uniref:Uncharacterized protein n=1 Tax=Aromia moschata TaxID=1265417 RepID=A0AAV8YBT1_9CUCU|nr:hypothetical protein NQ318_013223 [Aromia moschata]
MGCSAAKNLAVEPLDGGKATADLSNGNGVRKVSIPEKGMPPLEGEGFAGGNPGIGHTNGMSFEIAFDEDGAEESIIKKHPPKRFQRLEDPPPTPITLDKLQEKLEEAEIRRQQVRRSFPSFYRIHYETALSLSLFKEDIQSLKL